MFEMLQQDHDDQEADLEEIKMEFELASQNSLYREQFVQSTKDKSSLTRVVIPRVFQ